MTWVSLPGRLQGVPTPRPSCYYSWGWCSQKFPKNTILLDNFIPCPFVWTQVPVSAVLGGIEHQIQNIQGKTEKKR